MSEDAVHRRNERRQRRADDDADEHVIRGLEQRG